MKEYWEKLNIEDVNMRKNEIERSDLVEQEVKKMKIDCEGDWNDF